MLHCCSTFVESKGGRFCPIHFSPLTKIRKRRSEKGLRGQGPIREDEEGEARIHLFQTAVIKV